MIFNKKNTTDICKALGINSNTATMEKIHGAYKELIDTPDSELTPHYKEVKSKLIKIVSDYASQPNKKIQKKKNGGN
jgi:hypothetical protein